MIHKYIVACLSLLMLTLHAAQPPAASHNNLTQAVAAAISKLESIAHNKKDEKEKKELLDIAHALKESSKNTKEHNCPCPIGSSWH